MQWCYVPGWFAISYSPEKADNLAKPRQGGQLTAFYRSQRSLHVSWKCFAVLFKDDQNDLNSPSFPNAQQWDSNAFSSRWCVQRAQSGSSLHCPCARLPTTHKALFTSAGHPLRSAPLFRNVTFGACQPPTHLAYLPDLEQRRRPKFSVLREDKDNMHWLCLSKRQAPTPRGLGRLQGQGGGRPEEGEKNTCPGRGPRGASLPAPARLCACDLPRSFTHRHGISRKASKNKISHCSRCLNRLGAGILGETT